MDGYNVRCDCYNRCPDINELSKLGGEGKRFEDLSDQHEELCTRCREPVCGLRDELREARE